MAKQISKSHTNNHLDSHLYINNQNHKEVLIKKLKRFKTKEDLNCNVSTIESTSCSELWNNLKILWCITEQIQCRNFSAISHRPIKIHHSSIRQLESQKSAVMEFKNFHIQQKMTKTTTIGSRNRWKKQEPFRHWIRDKAKTQLRWKFKQNSQSEITVKSL